MKKYLKNILEQLQEGLPNDWQRLILHVIYGEEDCQIKYYVNEDGSKYTDCYNLAIPMQELILILSNTEDEVSELRESMKESNGLFVTMTLVVDHTGHVKADFGYDDVNEDIVKYCDDWEKKYLK